MNFRKSVKKLAKQLKSYWRERERENGGTEERMGRTRKGNGNYTENIINKSATFTKKRTCVYI